MRVDTARFLKSKTMVGISVTDKQITQLDRLMKFMEFDNQKAFKKQATLKQLPKILEAGVDSALIERFKRIRKYIPYGTSLYKSCILYNKVKGLEYWSDYTKFQSKKNTFEYKKEKYGMTKCDFDNFNKSRAITVENMIKKYGIEGGMEVYDSYIEKQKHAGVALEYFIEKYGIERGVIEYKRINKLKAHSYENILKRTGSLKAAEEWINDTKIGSAFYSEKSQKFIETFLSNIDIKDETMIYYATNDNGEFGVMCQTHKRYYRYDFVDYENKLCIEFHGDHYHANPKIYNSDDKLYVRGVVGNIAHDVWLNDKEKQNAIEARGFKYIAVWESEYDEFPQKTIERIISEYYSN